MRSPGARHACGGATELFDRDENFSMHMRVKGTAYVSWLELSLYFGLSDSAQRAQWVTTARIVQGFEAVEMWNATCSPAAQHVSQWAKKTDDIGACLRLVMRSEHILLAAIAFLNLAMTGVVYYESRDPRVHRWGV